MSAAALRDALGRAGVRCAVEAHDRLAVLVPDDADAAQRLTDPGTRRDALALAREHGFTHLALELRATDAPAHGAAVHRG